MEYRLTITTPEECRTALVKWLADQASNERNKGRAANRVGIRKSANDRAAAYQDAADFIAKIVIAAP